MPGEREHRRRDPDHEDAERRAPTGWARATRSPARAPTARRRDHRRALADVLDHDPARDVADQLADDEHRRDEPGDRERGADVAGDHRDHRDDRALADREQHRRQQSGDGHRPPPEGLLGGRQVMASPTLRPPVG